MAPITLSKSQFGATAAGKKPGASYEGYLGYIARHRAAKLAAPTADPFAPTSSQDINQIVSKYTAGYGAPQTDTQIQTSAQGQLDPIIAAITSNIQGTAKQSGAQIAANSAALAKALGSIDYAAPYVGAQHDQAAVDAALQQSLNGGGAALSADLTNRLGMIDDPTVGAAASGLASRGTAIGTNELASGSTNLGSLLAQAAAAKSYGLKQPGIASLAGLQDVAGVGRDATQKVGDATTQVMQLLPQVVSGLRSERDTKQSNKTSLAAQLYQTLTGQNVTKATAKEGLANTAFDNNLAAAQTFGIDPQTGTPTLAARKAADTAKAKTKPKPLTTTDKARLTKAADDLRYGVAPKQQFNSKTQQWMDEPNTGNPNSSYEEAYQALLAQGAPPAYARQLVNRLYKPGEYGRPASKATKKTNAAVKSGLGVPKTTGPFAGLTAPGIP